jgi:hypothetical protein
MRKIEEKKSVFSNELHYDSKLTRNNVGQYYLCINEFKETLYNILKIKEK